MLGVIQTFGRYHLLCASLASSAFLIHWDPRNEMNSVHAVVVSQLTAAGVGLLMWLLFGGGFAAAGCAIPLAILLMILLNAVHPPLKRAALLFLRLDPTRTFTYARVMDAGPPDANAMLECASLRLLAGDSAAYRRLCARLVERYGDTSDLGIVDNLSRVCTLAPEAVHDPARPVGTVISSARLLR
jgi:hypothetical protein